MSHQIYTTEAIVLENRNFGEANRWYFLLTPDFGLVVARAQGVRELKSKLRGHLPLFSLVQASLVRGRDSWHLIGAEEAQQKVEANPCLPAGRPRTLEKFPLASLEAQARVASLLRRLLPEAGADPALFAVVKQGFFILPVGEVELVWNILRALGYIARPEIGNEPKSVLIQEINHALSHSQL